MEPAPSTPSAGRDASAVTRAASVTSTSSAALPGGLVPLSQLPDPAPELNTYLFRGEEPPLPMQLEQTIDTILDVERGNTERMMGQMEAAWAAVEKSTALNKKRTAMLETDLPQALQDVGKSRVWDDELLKDHFQLSSILDAEPEDDYHGSDVASVVTGSTMTMGSMRSTATGLNGTRRKKPTDGITMKRRKKDAAAKSKPQEGASSAASPQHETNPYKLTEDELMDPMRCYAPLRRIFAPMFRKRKDFPIECTLLFNALKERQAELVPIEEGMGKSMFNLPLHLPFRAIAEHVTRTLGVDGSGSAMEKAYDAEHQPIVAELAAEYGRLHPVPAPRGPEDEDVPPPVPKDGAIDGPAMWDLLEKEMKVRQELHPRALQLIKDSVEMEQRLHAKLNPGQEATTTAVQTALTKIGADAATLTSTATEMLQKVASVKEQGESVHKTDLAVMDARLKSSSYKVNHSLAVQDKLVRRVREAVKELAREQVKHEANVKEHVDLLVKKEQLSVAFAQFSEACEARQSMLRDARATCDDVNALLQRVGAAANAMLDDCQKHVKRALTEEAFRKVRVSKRSIDNTEQWYRCVQDLGALHQQRFEVISRRMGDSWQLNYLLEHEKRNAAEALTAFRGELGKVDAAWKEVRVFLADFEIPAPPLARLDRDQHVIATRELLIRLDEAAKVKRRKAAAKATASSEAELPPQSTASQLPPVPSPRKQREPLAPKPPPRTVLPSVDAPRRNGAPQRSSDLD